MNCNSMLITLFLGLAIIPGQSKAQNVYNYDGNVEVRVEIQHYAGGNWQTASYLQNSGRYRMKLIVSNVSGALRDGFTRDYVDFKFKISGTPMRYYTNPGYTGNYTTIYDGFPKKGLKHVKRSSAPKPEFKK